MSEYVIKYEYNSWVDGCGCCSWSDSEVHIYRASREDGAYMSNFTVPLMMSEGELRDFINEYWPEYNDFAAHEDSRWF